MRTSWWPRRPQPRLLLLLALPDSLAPKPQLPSLYPHPHPHGLIAGRTPRPLQTAPSPLLIWKTPSDESIAAHPQQGPTSQYQVFLEPSGKDFGIPPNQKNNKRAAGSFELASRRNLLMLNAAVDTPMYLHNSRTKPSPRGAGSQQQPATDQPWLTPIRFFVRRPLALLGTFARTLSVG